MDVQRLRRARARSLPPARLLLAVAAAATAARRQGSALAVPVGTPAATAAPSSGAHALALALPDESHTRLVLQPEAVEWLRGLRGPVALVSIIGPYRSGKSFVLNQLLGVGCDVGFTVGHRRSTQTKGVWLWSAPMPAPRAADAAAPTIIFVDTEGIEGAGATGVYDDRIFSFAALLSSVLVYNVPEAVKEGDIEKLAFVVELATEFWSRVGPAGAGAGAPPWAAEAAAPAWAPPSLLWLIQRDFLQGADADAHVRASLQPVPNPSADEHIARLNRIRGSLGVFRNVRGIGVPQPALDRTKLCELAAAGQLPAEYTARLDTVRTYLSQHGGARAFGAGGGAGVAEFATRAIEALNAQDIPSVASVVDTFNAQLVERCAREYAAELESQPLPAPHEALLSLNDTALGRASARLRAQSFGGSADSEAVLRERALAAFSARADANFKASHERCARGWRTCEAGLRSLRGALLPSRARLNATLERCASALAGCVGPAAAEYGARHESASEAARAELLAQYATKLSTVCLVGSLGGVVLARFALKSALAEIAAWAALFVLEVAPRLDVLGTGSRGSLTDPASPRARAALEWYELAVYNAVWDLDALLGYVPYVLLLGLGARLWCRRRQQQRRRRAGGGGGGGGGGNSGGGGGDEHPAVVVQVTKDD